MLVFFLLKSILCFLTLLFLLSINHLPFRFCKQQMNLFYYLNTQYYYKTKLLICHAQFPNSFFMTGLLFRNVSLHLPAQKRCQKAEDHLYHIPHICFLPDLKQTVSISYLIGLIYITKERSLKSIKMQVKVKIFLVYQSTPKRILLWIFFLLCQNQN